MKNRPPLWFLIALGLYLLVQLMKRLDWSRPDWVNSYLSDFLCMPVILMICLLAVRVLKRNPSIYLDAWVIAVLTLEFVVVFEILLPRYSPHYTADVLDGLLYAAGSVCFYYWQRRSRIRSGNKQLSTLPRQG